MGKKLFADTIKHTATQWLHMVSKIWVDIGSSNSLLPDGSKSSLVDPSSMISNIHRNNFNSVSEMHTEIRFENDSNFSQG